MADYVPKNDAEFSIWQSNLINILTSNSTGWGIPANDLTMLVAGQAAWSEAYAAASNKQNRTSADYGLRHDKPENPDGPAQVE